MLGGSDVQSPAGTDVLGNSNGDFKKEMLPQSSGSPEDSARDQPLSTEPGVGTFGEASTLTLGETNASSPGTLTEGQAGPATTQSSTPTKNETSPEIVPQTKNPIKRATLATTQPGKGVRSVNPTKGSAATLSSSATNRPKALKPASPSTASGSAKPERVPIYLRGAKTPPAAVTTAAKAAVAVKGKTPASGTAQVRTSTLREPIKSSNEKVGVTSAGRVTRATVVSPSSTTLATKKTTPLSTTRPSRSTSISSTPPTSSSSRRLSITPRSPSIARSASRAPSRDSGVRKEDDRKVGVAKTSPSPLASAAKLEKLEKRAQELVAENTRLTTETEKIAVLQQQLEDREAQSARMAELEQAVASKAAELDQVNEKIKSLTEESSADASLKASLKEQLESTQAELESVTQKLEILQKESDAKIAFLEEEKSRVTDLEREVVELSTEVTQLSLLPQEVQSLKSELEKLREKESELEALRSAAHNRADEIIDLAEQRKLLEETLRNQSSTVESLQEEIKQLQAALQEKSQIEDAAKAKFDELTHELESLKESRDAILKEKEILSAELQDLRASSAEAEARKQDEISRDIASNATIESHEKLIQELEEKLRSLTSEYDAFKSSNHGNEQAAKLELDELRVQLVELEEMRVELGAAMKETISLRMQVEDMSEERDGMSAALLKAQANAVVIDDLHFQLEDSHRNHAAIVDDLRAQLDESHAALAANKEKYIGQFRKLEEDMKQAKYLYDEYKQQIVELSSENKSLKQEVSSHIDVLSEVKSGHEAEKAALTAQVTFLKEENEKVKNQLDRTLSELARLTELYTATEASYIQETNEKAASYKEQLETLENELASSRALSEEKDLQIAELRAATPVKVPSVEMVEHEGNSARELPEVPENAEGDRKEVEDPLLDESSAEPAELHSKEESPLDDHSLDGDITDVVDPEPEVDESTSVDMTKLEQLESEAVESEADNTSHVLPETASTDSEPLPTTQNEEVEENGEIGQVEPAVQLHQESADDVEHRPLLRALDNDSDSDDIEENDEEPLQEDIQDRAPDSKADAVEHERTEQLDDASDLSESESLATGPVTSEPTTADDVPSAHVGKLMADERADLKAEVRADEVSPRALAATPDAENALNESEAEAGTEPLATKPLTRDIPLDDITINLHQVATLEDTQTEEANELGWTIGEESAAEGEHDDVQSESLDNDTLDQISNREEQDSAPSSIVEERGELLATAPVELKTGSLNGQEELTDITEAPEAAALEDSRDLIEDVEHVVSLDVEETQADESSLQIDRELPQSDIEDATTQDVDVLESHDNDDQSDVHSYADEAVGPGAPVDTESLIPEVLSTQDLAPQTVVDDQPALDAHATGILDSAQNDNEDDDVISHTEGDREAEDAKTDLVVDIEESAQPEDSSPSIDTTTNEDLDDAAADTVDESIKAGDEVANKPLESSFELDLEDTTHNVDVREEDVSATTPAGDASDSDREDVAISLSGQDQDDVTKVDSDLAIPANLEADNTEPTSVEQHAEVSAPESNFGILADEQTSEQDAESPADPSELETSLNQEISEGQPDVVSTEEMSNFAEVVEDSLSEPPMPEGDSLSEDALQNDQAPGSENEQADSQISDETSQVPALDSALPVAEATRLEPSLAENVSSNVVDEDAEDDTKSVVERKSATLLPVDAEMENNVQSDAPLTVDTEMKGANQMEEPLPVDAKLEDDAESEETLPVDVELESEAKPEEPRAVMEDELKPDEPLPVHAELEDEAESEEALSGDVELETEAQLKEPHHLVAYEVELEQPLAVVEPKHEPVSDDVVLDLDNNIDGRAAPMEEDLEPGKELGAEFEADESQSQTSEELVTDAPASLEAEFGSDYERELESQAEELTAAEENNNMEAQTLTSPSAGAEMADGLPADEAAAVSTKSEDVPDQKAQDSDSELDLDEAGHKSVDEEHGTVDISESLSARSETSKEDAVSQADVTDMKPFAQESEFDADLPIRDQIGGMVTAEYVPLPASPVPDQEDNDHQDETHATTVAEDKSEKDSHPHTQDLPEELPENPFLKGVSADNIKTETMNDDTEIQSLIHEDSESIMPSKATDPFDTTPLLQ